MKYFLSIIVLLFFFSCKKEDLKKISIVTEYSFNSEKNVDSTYIKITNIDQKRIYNYGHEINDSIIRNYMYIEKIIDNDIYLRVFNENCVLIDTMTFTFNGQKTKVYKYLYDAENVSDDMKDYYFNDELGLIFVKDLSWNINIYYDPEELKELQESIIKNEDKFNSSFKHRALTKN